MSVVGCRCSVRDNVIVSTLDLWKVRGRMPYKMHEKREFNFKEGNSTYVCRLDISKYSSIVESYRTENGKVLDHSRSKIKDMYFENGALVIHTNKGPLRMMS